MDRTLEQCRLAQEGLGAVLVKSVGRAIDVC